MAQGRRARDAVGKTLPKTDGSKSPQRRSLTPVAPGSAPVYELAVIVPTFNERDNVRPLIEALDAALDGIAWEVIFVDDDSPDGTAALVREMSKERGNVRCIHRIGRRGLSSACLEGMCLSAAPFFAVIDADMQHDEAALPLMLLTLKRDQLDAVVGSRYVDGGGTGNWQQDRVRMGSIAKWMGQKALRLPLNDPTSGYFVIRREFLDETVRRMSGSGFKILMDMFWSSPRPVRFAEVPYEMRARERGVSKLDMMVVWEFIALIADKTLGRFIPLRFVLFVLIGCAGAALHLSILAVATKGFGLPFLTGQAIAAGAAMTVNFVLNNLLTYRDRRLRGWSMVGGLVSFYVACILGAGINLVLADFLFNASIPWWLAGLLGALVGSVWNFAITSIFTWGRKDAPRPQAVGAAREGD